MPDCNILDSGLCLAGFQRRFPRLPLYPEPNDRQYEHPLVFQRRYPRSIDLSSKKGTSNDTTIVSTPIRTDALAYLASENETHFGGQAPPSPFRHRVRLNDLIPATAYAYEVTQGASHFAATFTTAPIAREHRYIYFNRLKSTIQLGDTHGRLL